MEKLYRLGLKCCLQVCLIKDWTKELDFPMLVYLCPCICSVHTVLGQSPSHSLVSSVPVLVKEEVPGTTFYSFLFSKAWTVLMFLLKHFWLGQTPFFPHPPSMPLGWDRAERMILNPELQNLNIFFAGLSHSSC